MGKHKQKVRLPEEHLKGAPVFRIDDGDEDADGDPEVEKNGEEEAPGDPEGTPTNVEAGEDGGNGLGKTANSRGSPAGPGPEQNRRDGLNAMIDPRLSSENGNGPPEVPEMNDRAETDLGYPPFRPLLQRRPDSPPRPVVKPEPPRPTDVQILDIHTTKPLVSYNGHVFVCRWSENIGTELLFMPHDPSNALPKIRSLGEDSRVDLLAASSARIVSTSVRLQKHSVAPEPKAKYVRKAKPKIQRGQSEARNTQAAFLEQLIQIKEEAGEEDNVTVHVQKRLTNSKWRRQMKELRLMERENLGEIIHGRGKGRPKKTEEEINAARERLAEMDEEDEEIRKVEEDLGPDRRYKKRKSKVGADDPVNAKKTRRIDWGKSTLPLGDLLNRGEGGASTIDGESVAAGSPMPMEEMDEDEEDEEGAYGYEQYGSLDRARFEGDGSSDDDASEEEDGEY